MAIIAAFTGGINEVTVNGLYQWDYGQTLTIQADDIPAVAEVHFANKLHETAIVRAAVMNTDLTSMSVAIPDELLEDPYDMTAYVYYCGTGYANTAKIIHLPITRRAKPSSIFDPVNPSEQTQFTNMITQLNEVAGACTAEIAAFEREVGEDIVALDRDITTLEDNVRNGIVPAGIANKAHNAESLGYYPDDPDFLADNKGALVPLTTGNDIGAAESPMRAYYGKKFVNTDLSKIISAREGWTSAQSSTAQLPGAGVYIFEIDLGVLGGEEGHERASTVAYWNGAEYTQIAVGINKQTGPAGVYLYCLQISPDGIIHIVKVSAATGGGLTYDTDISRWIQFIRIM